MFTQPKGFSSTVTFLVFGNTLETFFVFGFLPNPSFVLKYSNLGWVFNNRPTVLEYHPVPHPNLKTIPLHFLTALNSALVLSENRREEILHWKRANRGDGET